MICLGIFRGKLDVGLKILILIEVQCKPELSTVLPTAIFRL